MLELSTPCFTLSLCVLDFWCLERLLLVLKAKPHSTQGNGRSLVCVRMCLSSTLGFGQIIWQKGQVSRFRLDASSFR